MSKKNIISTKWLSEGKAHVVFKTSNGTKTYEFSGSSARAFKKGSDPAQLSGKLIEKT